MPANVVSKIKEAVKQVDGFRETFTKQSDDGNMYFDDIDREVYESRRRAKRH